MFRPNYIVFHINTVDPRYLDFDYLDFDYLEEKILSLF